MMVGIGLTILYQNSPSEISVSSTSIIPPSTCNTREYYVRIVINDENGVDTTPFVDIKDPTGKQVFFGQTNQNGEITIPLCSLKKYNVTIMKENSCSVLFYPRESEYRMVCK